MNNARMATVAALLVGLAAGFAAGRLSSGKAASSDAGDSGHGSFSEQVGIGHFTDQHDIRSETKSRRPDRQPSVARVSLPLTVVVDSLRKQQFQYSGFERALYALPNALSLLGVREDEQQAVIEMMQGIQKQILAEEKARLKVSKVTETELILDQSGMLEPMKQIVADAHEGIRENLSADIAEALIGAINWEEFYTGGPQAPVTTFRIKRTSDGLIAQRNYQGGGMGLHLDSKQFPDDGTPISIREAYGENRWVPFLGDHKLLPVDD